jgi:hypothetical protein
MGNQPMPEQMVTAPRTFCEKNSLKFPTKTGRPPISSSKEILALIVFWQILKVRIFSAFHHGKLRKAWTEFSTKLPENGGGDRSMFRQLSTAKAVIAVGVVVLKIFPI